MNEQNTILEIIGGLITGALFFAMMYWGYDHYWMV